MPQRYLNMDAQVSDDGQYRYWLNRRWSGLSEQSVAFVGLNPSTADASTDDPTIRKCVGFASRWGFPMLTMLNIHAYRSTDPKNLVKLAKVDADRVIGPENERWLLRIAERSELVIAAWGATPLTSAAQRLCRIVLAMPQTRALRITSKGKPEHPLYIPYDVELVRL